MKVCQSVIVTLIIGSKKLDMELPAFLPITDVNVRILETLRAIYPQVYGACTAIRLCERGTTLAGNKTLASYGIWDGAVLRGDIALQ